MSGKLAFHRTSREAAVEIIENGLLSRKSLGLEANCPAMAWASDRVEMTYISVKGVQKNWVRDGVTIALDLEAIEASGLEIRRDDFGAFDVRDMMVHGDIPAAFVLGIVSDEYVEAHGYKCLMD
tara:strand:- start:137 stop:508 length:372 start_codon:yes stop_codon:yes gene_type:complete